MEAIMTPQLRPPYGLAGIAKAFGDIESFIALDKNGKPALSPEFEKHFIAKIALPSQIRSAIGKSEKVRSIRCHRLLATSFESIFAEICARDLTNHIHSIDGCYVFRPKRFGVGLSTHSWGIAIDINAASNRRGTAGDMNQEIIEIFKTAGFIWGGNWMGRNRDPMHFQFCAGY
jgi:hypothetical protein